MGRLKWTEYEYYTSSPEAVYYAFQGYFDEEEDHMMIMRKVAYSFVGGPLAEFNRFWPTKQKEQTTLVLDDEMREKIMRIHNIKPKE